MMHTPVIRSVFSRSLAPVLHLAMSSTAWTQTAAPNSDWGVKAVTGDAAFNVGWSNIPARLNPSDTNNHSNFGVSAASTCPATWQSSVNTLTSR